MKKKTWTAVEAAASGSRLEAGGYVLVVQEVEDNPGREQLTVTYDIAEGPSKGHYSDSFGLTNKWAHQTKVTYSDKAARFFKVFLDALEASNPTFDTARWEQACDEQQFVGLIVGCVLQERMYTNREGKDKTVLRVFEFVPANDIRSGRFQVPEPLDDRVGGGSSAQAAANAGDAVYSDIPF